VATEKKTVICPECGKEVDLNQNDGVCQNCQLDVAWCIEKRRRDRAVAKLAEAEQEAQPQRKRRFEF